MSDQGFQGQPPHDPAALKRLAESLARDAAAELLALAEPERLARENASLKSLLGAEREKREALEKRQAELLHVLGVQRLYANRVQARLKRVADLALPLVPGASGEGVRLALQFAAQDADTVVKMAEAQRCACTHCEYAPLPPEKPLRRMALVVKPARAHLGVVEQEREP